MTILELLRPTPRFDLSHMRWNLVLDGGQPIADRFLACYQALTGTSLDDQPHWDLVSLFDLLLDIDPDHPGDIDARRPPPPDHLRQESPSRSHESDLRHARCLVRVCPQPHASARTSLHAQLPRNSGRGCGVTN
jgi:hypothetical protein